MEIPYLPAGRASNDLVREKTASASDSLAHNLAANATNGEKTVHQNTMGQPAEGVKRMADVASEKPVWTTKPPAAQGSPEITRDQSLFTLRDYGGPPYSSFSGAAMRSISALLACVSLLAGQAALADSRVFIIANQPDGYGVDQCLARGERCGAHAAQSYCQSRSFAQASSYRRVDADEITGSVPKDHENCGRSGCGEYIAITCQR